MILFYLHSQRGIIHQNETQYVIHPLPDRFGNTSHIILEMPAATTMSSSSTSSIFQPTPLPLSPEEIDDPDTVDGTEFEPHLSDFEPTTESTTMRPDNAGNLSNNICIYI